jgi:transcriptional regulator with GAF, ATPase, and Fis domain
MKKSVNGCAHGLVGESQEFLQVRRLIDKAARNRLPVLLLGESGTGKEVVARAIYQGNPRGQFVPIDCGSLVGTLMESELFGHVKGAFSGAVGDKKGLVEIADGGTVFFDEIGDLPLEMQVKLLRLIQEREFRAVGALQWKQVDLRVIAATHRNLKAAVAEGKFREDLFYRLNVFPIHIPPLRERRGDISLLIEYFLNRTTGPDGARYEPDAQVFEMLMGYEWPGNVRELKHCVERMAALHSDGAVRMADMPSALQNFQASVGLESLSDAVADESVCDDDLPYAVVAPRSPVLSIRETQRQAIAAALAATGGERGRAAGLLRISRTTLYRRMKEYKMD